MHSQRRRRGEVVGVCAAVAICSLISIMLVRGEPASAPSAGAIALRSAAMLLNAGTVWAAVPVFAGWRVAHPRMSILAGVLAAEGTLLLHYALGILLNVYEPSIVAKNGIWLLAGVVVCAPLGWCGWLATQKGWPGRVTRLIVPIGALLEPFVRGWFSPAPFASSTERHAGLVSGVILVSIGAIASVASVRAWWPREARDHEVDRRIRGSVRR